jgi:hypothetical protein
MRKKITLKTIEEMVVKKKQKTIFKAYDEQRLRMRKTKKIGRLEKTKSRGS